MIRKAGLAAILFSLGTLAWAADEAAPAAAAADPEIEAAKARQAEEDKRVPEDVDMKNLPLTVTDLIVAIRQDECTQVKKMLDAGVKPNQYDSFGYTPLTVAAIDKKESCVYYLLQAGADPKIASAAGWTPLIGAAMAGGSGILIEMLLNYGADINARNQWGCNSLYYAAGFGALPTVDYLLLRGAKYPGTDGECMTPLKIAQMREYPEVIKRLEKAEADAKAGIVAPTTPPPAAAAKAEAAKTEAPAAPAK